MNSYVIASYFIYVALCIFNVGSIDHFRLQWRDFAWWEINLSYQIKRPGANNLWNIELRTKIYFARLFVVIKYIIITFSCHDMYTIPFFLIKLLCLRWFGYFVSTCTSSLHVQSNSRIISLKVCIIIGRKNIVFKLSVLIVDILAWTKVPWCDPSLLTAVMIWTKLNICRP